MSNFDITKHILVPKHTILSKEEAEAILKKFNISLLQLPVLKITDPVAKALKLKAGDVVKIERKSPTGTYNYFRRVSS